MNIWVKETLLCAARKIPYAGTAIEITSAVAARREALERDTRLSAVEENMSRLEQRIHDAVQELIVDAMQQLSQPNISGVSLHQLVNEFREINEQGYHTLLFEGLFQNCSHYQELKQQPGLYGQLLDDQQSLPEGMFPIFLDADKTRLLAVPPAALSLVLSTARQDRAQIVTATDVWALPQSLKMGVPFRDRLRDGTEGPEMVVIPAGQFLMGSPASELKRYDNERQHEVTIEQAFALGQYAVTFEEYDRYCRATGSEIPDDEDWGRGRRPVINVNWFDAMAYAEWLSEQTGQAYRLPSEAEWEYACRSGTTTPFHFGETISTAQANYNGDYTYGRGAKGEYRRKTLPVGSFPANPWGLHDMHGNVWEWTGSEYDENYQGAEQRLLNRDAPDVHRRAVRGGSWVNGPWRLRSAFRDFYTAAFRDDELGFRLARSL